MNADAVGLQQAHRGGTVAYPESERVREQVTQTSCSWTNAEPMALMEAVLEPSNLRRAYQRVVGNKGAPGVNSMPVDALKDHLTHWPTLKD
ncbi:hypothetical protein [Saccharospirillum sp.]|uniref:hypothetical protein n=1 Tax=Saccharospirillum sp. TaxID=2033801 RepID=UPI00349FF6B2